MSSTGSEYGSASFLPAGIVNFLKSVNILHLLWVSVLLSEVLTAIIVAPLSVYFRGRVTSDYMITGAVTAFIVSFIVCSVIIYLVLIIRKVDASMQEKAIYLDNILRSSTDMAIAATDTDFRIKYYNPIAERIFGYRAEDVIGKTVMEMHTKEKVDPSRFEKAIETVKTRGAYTYTVEKKSEEGPRIIDSRVSGIWDEGGKLIGFVLMSRDITELRRNYQIQEVINSVLELGLEPLSLQEILERILDTIISIPWLSSNSKGAIFLVDEDRDVLKIKVHRGFSMPQLSQCAEIPYGRCICGRAALSRTVQFVNNLDERHETRYEGIKPHGHYCVPILSGERLLGVINLELEAGHIYKQQEIDFLTAIANTLAMIIQHRMVEEEKELLQAQFLQSQKMEAIGHLAGGIAHDFNNILTAIIGYSTLLQQKMKEDDPMRSMVNSVISSAERAANLTQELLAFSRKQIINPKPVEINDLVKDMEKLLLRLIGEDIEFRTILSEQQLWVVADRGQLEQVIMNLITNARDAMPGGGILSIETATVEITRRQIDEQRDVIRPGRYAVISISDTGTGMDEETKEHIFEPFYTTKDVGKGTGLGLSVVYGIVKQHNGHIKVYSEKGHGTTFRIYLPLGKADIKEEKTEQRVELRGGTETVLLAEDESAVRELIKTVLTERGYEVIEAVDGRDAIEKFTVNRDRINLMILDVVMPEKSGREVYEEIKRIRPDIKVLFTSGYTSNIIQQKGVLDEGINFISKPVSPDELLIKVREVLEER
ncbi:MAG TPA: response regulator [Nitrospirae bacterium]|nr:response regulator [Nitrospirota bacterium]